MNIHIFDLKLYVRTEILHGHPGEVVTVIFAPCFDHGYRYDTYDSRYLLASQSEQEGGANAVITLWEFDENGEQVQSVEGSTSSPSLQFPGGLGSFDSPVLSTDGMGMVYLELNMSVHPNHLSQYTRSVILWDTTVATITQRRDLERRHLSDSHQIVTYASLCLIPIDNSSRITRESMERTLQELRTRGPKSRRVQMMTFATLLDRPLFTGYLDCWTRGVETKSPPSTYQKQFFLIPRWNGSLSNLDQHLALVGGNIVLLASVRGVYRSRQQRGHTLRILMQRRRSV